MVHHDQPQEWLLLSSSMNNLSSYNRNCTTFCQSRWLVPSGVINHSLTQSNLWQACLSRSLQSLVSVALATCSKQIPMSRRHTTQVVILTNSHSPSFSQSVVWAGDARMKEFLSEIPAAYWALPPSFLFTLYPLLLPRFLQTVRLTTPQSAKGQTNFHTNRKSTYSMKPQLCLFFRSF